MFKLIFKNLSLIVLLSLSSGVYAALTDGLVAYYPFDGNANDMSGKGNNGTVNGAILTTDRNGNADSAYSFDGASNNITVPNNPSQQISTNQLSISAWISLEKDIPYTQWRIVNKQESAWTSWGFELFGNGYAGGKGNNLTFHNSSGNTWVNCVVSEISLIPNTIYHVAAISENNSAKIYLDGQLIKTCSNMLGIPYTINSDMVIGSSSEFSDFFFKGKMDDLRIYNRALTEAEIKQLYVGNTTCPADTNGATQTGIDLVKATPANYGLFTQAQIDAAKQTGIQSCKDNPASCGLFSQTQYNAAKQVGIDLVKAKPNDYGITIKSLGGFTQDELNTAKTASIQDGINQCKTNPNSFGLFTQAQLDAAKLAGVQSCKNNPASCGLFNQAQLDAAVITAKETAKQSCKNDPASCGISIGGFTQAQLDAAVNAAKETAKQSCKNDPSSCGINIGFTQAQLDAAVNSAKQIALQDGINQCKADPNCKGSTNAIHATYNPLNGEVHIPFIDVPNGIGFTQTFDVYLMQRNGSFTFDLDLNRIVIVH
jgi:hypothetical protein